MISEELLGRFWSQVEKSGNPDGCWLWTGQRTYGGHGFLVIVRNEVVVRAHRLSWQLHRNAKLSSKTLIGHTCGVKTCVNPEHLKIVKHSHWHRKTPEKR